MTCRVCGAENAESHFGGHSCRACAAFFRRYVNSTKLIILCTCKQRTDKSYLCRRCRMNKCLAIGMTKNKVQSSREKNTRREIPNCHLATLSLLTCNIIPRACTKITHTIEGWPELDQKRKALYGACFYDLNFLEMSNFSRTDTMLLWNLGELIFPDLKYLNAADKDAIICNFFPRWIVLESSIDFCTNQEYHLRLLESDGLDRMITRFYGTSMSDKSVKTDMEIVNTFKPYWNHFYSEIAKPIFKMKLDKVECIALFLVILFDDGFTNISGDGAALCRNLRKIVFKELKGYQTDNDCCETRFLDVLSILMLLEKGEEKLQEEILICGLNNVILHDDFKSIVQIKKI